ncbi:MAG: BrnT family toxin [Acidobacteria bacterium]|nr:BrnT family toxin [Acidobacteriota bacterium]
MLILWDSAKANSNLKKHGVDFQEAASVLDDGLAVTVPDAEHSSEEPRYLTIGLSIRLRTLIVAHSDDGSIVRIISARKATVGERRYYEQ